MEKPEPVASEDETKAYFDHLAERYMEGDETVVPELVTTYFKKVEGVVRRKLGHLLFDDEVNGVTQEAFVKAWRAHAAFDICEGTLASWLIRIAINRGIDLIRSGHREERPAQVSLEEHSIPVFADEDDGEPLDEHRRKLIAKVEDFIDTLPRMEQSVARADLATPNGKADTERLARGLEVAQGNIRQTRWRYKKKMKEHFRKLGYDETDE